MTSRLLFGVCLAAMAASAVAQQVVLDPKTGQLRTPEYDETPAPAADARGASPTSMFDAHPAVQRMRAASAPKALHGATVKRMDVGKMSFSVAQKNADGTLDTHCVTGEHAANAALAGKHSGGKHDH
jgi:hypothetical protein